MTSFIKNSGKCKLIYGERKRMPAWRTGGVGGRTAGGLAGCPGTFGDGEYAHSLERGDGFMNMYTWVQ